MLLENASDKSDWIEDHSQISLFVFFLSFLFFICKMKQLSLKGDRAFAAWHSRGLVIILGWSRRVMLWTNLDDGSKKHKAGESGR